MPDELHVLVFGVRGDIEIRPRVDETNETYETERKETERKVVTELTKQAEPIGRSIEREVSRILPPGVTVQANVEFDEGGSVVITGTVALLSWAGPILREAAKKEFAELVKLAIHRVISRALAQRNASLHLTVTPQPTTAEPTPESAAPPPVFAGSKITASTALLVITVLILILQIITILDRIHIRP